MVELSKSLNKKQISNIANILRESKDCLLKFSDYFLPHYKLDDLGRPSPPATIHKEFETLLRGAVGNGNGDEPYNVLGIIPRGVAKSTIGGLIFGTWCAIFTNKMYMVIVGASEESVKDHMANIKSEIKTNKLFHMIGLKPDPTGLDNAQHFDFIAPNYPGASYKDGIRRVRLSAYSTSSFPRGKNTAGRRPDLMIIDDLEQAKKGNKTGVENKNYRDEIRKIFESEIVPSGFNDTAMQIIMLGTVMHEAQLLYQIYEQSKAGTYYPTFKYIKYSMIENYGTPEAYSIWPEKMSVEDFNKKMLSAKQNGTESIVYNEYLSMPTSPDNEIFNRGDFKYFVDRAGALLECDSDGELVPEGFNVNKRHTSVVVAADLAFTVEKKSDYTSFAVCACDNDENIYILDIVYGKWLGHSVAKRAGEILDKYRPVSFAVESNSGGMPIISIMEKELFGNKNFDKIIPIKNTGLSKQDRIISKLQFPYKNGKIFHKYGADYIPEYEYQVLSVTRDGIKCQHDDLVDSVSMTYDITEDGAVYNSDSNDSDYYEESYEGSSYL